ncbi:FHA domain-containing protein [Microbacterium sp. STN6]|uniref:FHA domain-containing protein n=1 Tax=Microbacterium sp. STN6 TaxID=2995588 RepID=UPI002260B40C|nr:FHA domain-containing protein [Microbacterium sp. STN6]MCX7522078.1 FHA domain-containing protein [Microbacterium sp. STN6]
MLQIHQATPGSGWLALAGATRVLVVNRPDAPDERAVRELWECVTAHDGVQRCLESLAAAGLAATPAFALVEWESDPAVAPAVARVIVRGGVRLSVSADAQTRDVSATGVSTWVEQIVENVSRIEIVCPTEGELSSAALPLQVGASWVSAVSIGALDGDDVEATVVLPRPAAAHEPAAAAAPAADEPATAAADEPASHETIVEATLVETELAEPVLAEPVLAAAPSGYDHLFGQTVVRTVEDAAVRPGGDEPTEESERIDVPAFVTDSSPVKTTGDHDGFTVVSGDIDRMRATAGSAPTGSATPDPASHDSASATPAAAPPPPAPQFAIELMTGAFEPLDSTVLVGRAPSAKAISNGRVPRFVTVGNGDQDISRNHVQFEVQGDTVVVTDLHSRNGTIVVLPGKPPQKLRAGEPTSIITGTVVDLGGGVSMTVRQE